MIVKLHSSLSSTLSENIEQEINLFMNMSVKFEQINPSNEIKQNNKASSLVIVSIRFRYLVIYFIALNLLVCTILLKNMKNLIVLNKNKNLEAIN